MVPGRLDQGFQVQGARLAGWREISRDSSLSCGTFIVFLPGASLFVALRCPIRTPQDPLVHLDCGTGEVIVGDNMAEMPSQATDGAVHNNENRGLQDNSGFQ